jgi:polyisoprenoid-binding protein YceI
MIRSRLLLALAVPALGLAAFVAATPAAPTSAPAASRADASGVYAVDGVHSSLVFRIKHMNVSWFYGRFNELSGQVTMDEAKPENSAVEFTAQAGSVDSGNGKRDQHIKSPDFLNADEFPEISFKSDKVKGGKDGRAHVSGKLTLHGVTQPLEFDVEAVGTAEGKGGSMIAGWEATFTIKRSDFGMSEMLDNLGDEVRIIVSIEGRKDA